MSRNWQMMCESPGARSWDQSPPRGYWHACTRLLRASKAQCRHIGTWQCTSSWTEREIRYVLLYYIVFLHSRTKLFGYRSNKVKGKGFIPADQYRLPVHLMPDVLHDMLRGLWNQWSGNIICMICKSVVLPLVFPYPQLTFHELLEG